VELANENDLKSTITQCFEQPLANSLFIVLRVEVSSQVDMSRSTPNPPVAYRVSWRDDENMSIMEVGLVAYPSGEFFTPAR
jgi:hypothetical protein